MQNKNDPNSNSTTQQRKAHVARMQANGQWDPKTTPAEDPSRRGFKPIPGKRWDRDAMTYVDI